MTKIFKADTLDDAYKQISQDIDIPISKLDIEVLQTHSAGILGMMKKGAILKVHLPDEPQPDKPQPTPQSDTDTQTTATQEPQLTQPSQAYTPPLDLPQETARQHTRPIRQTTRQDNKDTDSRPPLEFVDKEPQIKYKVIEDDDTKDIRPKLDKLFSIYCLDISIDKLHKTDDHTVYIKLIGDDAKIVIGTKGFRYDSLSFMLNSWLKRKYNLDSRLEILQYLQNKQHKVAQLLEKFYEDVTGYGYGTTVELSGQYLRIAVDLIQHKFPDRQLIFEETQKGRKTIKIDDRQDVL